jgi:preprotein translocase subunit SecA
MLELIAKGLAKVFGTKSDRDIKELTPKVALINEAFDKLKNLSDDELRAKTTEIKSKINDELKSFDDRIADLRVQINALSPDKVHEKDALFNEIEKTEKSRDEALEVVLEKVMFDAFAVVKETARRFKENGKLVVKANIKDKELAAKKTQYRNNGRRGHLAQPLDGCRK